MKKSAVLIYKNTCAISGETEGDKFLVNWCVSRATPTGKKAVYGSQKVREKDVVLLTEKPASSIDACLDFAEKTDSPEIKAQIEEVYELLISDESTSSAFVDFEELLELIRGEVKADEAWGIYSALKNDFLFEEMNDSGDGGCVRVKFAPRSREKIQELKDKAYEKEHAEELRGAFITRLRQGKLNLPDDAKYMVEVEAFALGKSEKCKTLKDAMIKETVERAHDVLLKTGIWDITRNPYPLRWGLSAKSASQTLGKPPEEDRVLIPGVSYAIDSPWSTDPDDAIGWDGEFLWVHIADPASTVLPDSSIDKSARGRGATLYIPEGASRMLSEDCLEDYALGLTADGMSRALSFKIKLDENSDIEDCEILRTIVKVQRLTYEKADELKDTPELKPLFQIARKNAERRSGAGAVSINMPEIHVNVDPETKKVSLSELVRYESGEVVREAMILAGEGAAKFAFKNNIPFPFISQDAPNIPAELPEGLAGQYRLRRCMRKRNVGVTPGAHAAMGLSMYSQVTSPLRRYGDLIGHQQLRAFIKGEPLIDKDDMLMRVAEGDAAARAAKQAERNSNTHWTLVYLLQNPDWTGTAVCLNIEPKQTVFLVKELGIETVIEGTSCSLNDEIKVKPSKISLPDLEVKFIPV